jgi:hypothetical protein
MFGRSPPTCGRSRIHPARSSRRPDRARRALSGYGFRLRAASCMRLLGGNHIFTLDQAAGVLPRHNVP